MKLRVVQAGQCVGFPASFTQLMAGSASTTQLSAWKLFIAGSITDIWSPVKDLIHRLQEFVLAATVTYLNCDLVPCLNSQKNPLSTASLRVMLYFRMSEMLTLL